MPYFQHKSQLIYVGEVQGHLNAGGFTVPLREYLQIVGRQSYEQMARDFPVEDPAQRDPPKRRHHDHLIPRHIRSPQSRDRRP